MIIRTKAYLRVGLIGNPSDGYLGKTISFAFSNFCAKVVLYETPELELLPSEKDRSVFGSIGELVRDVDLHGYYGDAHQLGGSVGNIAAGRYDFNHFIRKDFSVSISLPSGVRLKEDVDYKLHKGKNTFEITNTGKTKIDTARVTCLSITYKANDAAGIGFKAWGENRFNPHHGWLSENLTMISNKVRGKTDTGVDFVKSFKADYEAFKK